jgi:3-oxoacyl-[acyl-carrier-protein] synthase II
VGPFGLGRAALEAVLTGRTTPAAVEVDRSAGFHRAGGARTALFARDLDLQPLLGSAAARRWSAPARFAVAAARLGLDDAGLGELPRAAHAATAIVSGTAFGPPLVTELLLRQIVEQGPETASPALFAESVANAAAAQVALAFGARGPNLTFACREASDLVALGHGLRLVEAGRAERALVLVVDEMIPLLHAVLDRFGALARPDAAGREGARPFDRDRSGVLASEGAVVLVLEPARSVAERGARPLCRLLAAGSGFDPTAPSWDFGTGHQVVAGELTRGLARSGTAPDEVDLWVAGAGGSRRGDALLGRALERLAEPWRPVLAPKGVLGEYGGGFLGAAVLHAGGLPARATAGFERPDDGARLVPHAGGELAPPARTVAATVAAGGGFAWALLGAPEGVPGTP